VSRAGECGRVTRIIGARIAVAAHKSLKDAMRKNVARIDRARITVAFVKNARANPVHASAIDRVESLAGPVVAAVVRRAQTFVASMRASDAWRAGVPGAANGIGARIGRARSAVARTAEIRKRAYVIVAAGSGEIGADALPGGRIASIPRAGIAVVAVDGGIAALSRRGIAKVLRAQAAVAAILRGSRTGRRAARRCDASVVGSARALVVAWTSNGGGGSCALSRRVAHLACRARIPVVACHPRGLTGPHAMEGTSRGALA